MGAHSPLAKNSPQRISRAAPESGMESVLGIEVTTSHMESRRPCSDLSRPFSLYPSPSISKSCMVFFRCILSAFGKSFSSSVSKNLLRVNAVFVNPYTA